MWNLSFCHIQLSFSKFIQYIEKSFISGVLDLLKSHFGYNKFRTEEQNTAVLTVIERQHDVFVNMPTGRPQNVL